MVQILSWLHSTFKELSNEYSNAQIRVKTKKLWPRQVREEKPVAVHKIVSRLDLMSRPEDLCRELCHELCCDLCRDKLVSRSACCVATKNDAET